MMEAGLSSMDREIVLEGIPVSDVGTIYDAVRFDNPCIPLALRLRKEVTLSGSLHVLPDYSVSRRVHEANSSRLAEIGDRFSETVNSSPFDIELAVHDHLSDSVRYKKDLPSDFSMNGPLLDRHGACEGISKAALYLLRRCGVDAGIVSGKTESGENHAWNMVHIDGGCYHLDVTWDLGSRNGVTRHDYFNVNDGFMGRSRTWTDAYPSTSMDCNYYSRSGSVVYRADDLGRMFREYIRRGQRIIEFRVCDAIRDGVDESSVERSLRRELEVRGGRYTGSYSQSTGCCVFNIDYLR